MTYCGSKRRIAKYITPILQQELNKNTYKGFIDLCCGGCNIIEHIIYDNKIAIDKNFYLIELFKYLQQGNKLPEYITREDWDNCKNHPEAQEPWFVGAVSILGSFANRGFSGGYATPSATRNYYHESLNGTYRQIEKLKDVTFLSEDLFNVNYNNYVIYVDPPYKNNQKYGKQYSINHVDFWDKMRKLSEQNKVFISELEAPDDFQPIWQSNLEYNIKDRKKTVNECLFIYNPII